MNTRTVNLHFNAVQQTEMQHATNYDKWISAVGYLATWNLTYPTVDIYHVDEINLLAVYRNEAGERGYTIGAVWHEDHYGFHS